MTNVSIKPLVALTRSEIEELCDVLIDCVEAGASVSFMWPMTREKALTFWADAAASAARGERVILGAYAGEVIVGTVSVVWAGPENQPHRGDVAKMLVKREARNRGVGEALLAAAERVARERGKTLLMLDTVTDTPAYRLYSRNGWQRVGEIPNYALWPDGRPCPTTVFYKALV